MAWDLEQLEQLISKEQDFVVTRESDVLMIANGDGLDAWLAISGEQILVESLLFAVDEVEDTAQLNEMVLKTHMMLPLTTVGLSDVNGVSYYTAFGALSAQSKESSILIEIHTLFDNVEGFLDAYSTYLK